MKRIVSVPIALLLLSSPLVSQWVPQGKQLRAQQGMKSSPVKMVDADGLGGAYVVWSAKDGFAYIQRVSSDGYALWENGGKSLGTGEYPTVWKNGDTGVFVAWEVYGGIRVQKLDLQGNMLWDEGGAIATMDIRGGSGPCIIMDGEGGVIVSWVGMDPGGIGFILPRVQRFDAFGNRLWGETAITLCDRTFCQWHYDVTIVGDGTKGGAIVSWLEDPSCDNQQKHAYAQRIDAEGRPLWTKNGVSLSDWTTGWRQHFHAVSDDAGGAFVSWDNLSLKEDAVIQHIDSNGNRHLGNKGLQLGRCINDYNLLRDGRGGVFVLSTFPKDGKRLQHIDHDDNLLFDEHPAGVLVGTEGDKNLLALDGHGGFFIVETARYDWQAGHNYIYCQHVDSSGRRLWGRNGIEICNTAFIDAACLDITATAPGEAMVVWYDWRQPEEAKGVYIAKVTESGIALPVQLAAAVPRVLTLAGPYPNPAASNALLACTLAEKSDLRVTLADLSGREIGLLYEGEQPAGEFYVPIDTSPLSPGSYFVVAKAGAETRVVRLVVARRE